ncbi:hypothetical protein N0V90_009492 [Kalmusia sp. IMI 367209]|nr:hypothetical protein N0V90_009492 [Kalmusia sp. IMI 367209]
MVTELFENRRKHFDGSFLANTARQIHVALTKWLSALPGKLHWNQWSVGQVPAYTLHLHMLFHTTMILLHHPPRKSLQLPNESTIEDMETCNESLRAILKLMRTYARYYSFRYLPLDFVHTLSTAASILLIQRDLGDCLDELNTSKPLDTVLSAMDKIQYTWPCVAELRTSLVHEIHRPTVTSPSLEDVNTEFMAIPLDSYGALWNDMPQLDNYIPAAALGHLITDDFLIDQFS